MKRIRTLVLAILFALSTSLALGVNFGDRVTFEGPVTLEGATTITGALLVSTEIVTAANTITAAECGTTYYLNSATEFASTLPAISTVSAGCVFRFVIKAAAASANYTVLTGNSLENLVYGSMEVAGAVIACAQEDTITLVDGNAIGDWVELESDGVLWYISGSTVTTAKATCTQAD